MGDGTEKNPYTREDVLKKIEEMKGSYDWVNLSGGKFENKVDLRDINLHGIILRKAILYGARLEGVNLSFAKLEGIDLSFAHLEGADLSFAYLEGADLFSTEYSPETKLADVEWGNYVLCEEEKLRLGPIENPYRRLKQWYTNAGMYGIAGKFFYREMEVKRKSQKWKKEPHLKLWSWVLRLLCGYGEKPERAGISAAVVIFGLAVAYYLLGTFSSSSFIDTLYYSVVSFVALGYGSWAPQPIGWAKYMGAAEAVFGVFMMALFLVTFTRKMTR